VDVSNIFNVSKAYTAYILRVEMLKLMSAHIYRSLVWKRKRGRGGKMTNVGTIILSPARKPDGF
jgi:hypothetical protein